MLRVYRRLFLLLLAALLIVGGAQAQEQEEGLVDPLARELKSAGDSAMQSLRYEEALAAYERATAIEQHPILMFNRARALQALQRYPEALDHFEAFKKEASPALLAKAGKLDELIERLRQQVSTIEIVCNVKGATVLVRGTVAGKTPLDGPIRVNAGQARISVSADGYITYAREVELLGAETKRLEVRLNAKKSEGRLTVKSPVTGAVVYVDGERLGVVPAETALETGRHEVRLTHPGFLPANTTVEIVRGETKELDLGLEKTPGILKKWWFWTGAGVVVAGGVGLTIALTTEKKAGAGDIPPGTISAPLVRF